MKKMHFIIMAVIVFVLSAISYNIFSCDQLFGCLLNHTFYHTSALVAVMAGIMAFRRYGLGAERGRSLLYLTLAVAFWSLADLIGNILLYGFKLEIFPSFIDVIYLIGYPFLFIALIIEMRITNLKWSTKKITQLAILSIIMTAVASYATIYLAYDTGNDYWANIFNMFYGFGDILLANLSIYILFAAQEYHNGKFFSVYMTLFLAIFLTFIADILYGAFYSQYGEGIMIFKSIDVVYIAAYLLFGYSFFSIDNMVIEAQQRLKEMNK
jgi:hypothetical protein